MSVNIFISYFSEDRNKMEALRRAFSKIKDKFTPVIIARRAFPSKPLSEKVKDGILESSFLIPILSRSSIKTQWVNQEIGFAEAKNKNILPLVESSIIHDLKGFIHDQIDLPFQFDRDSNPRKEAMNFQKCYKNLLDYLQNVVVESFRPSIRPRKVKQNEKYTTIVNFKGLLNHGFFDNYVEHLKSSWRTWNWDRNTLKDTEPTTAGELQGKVSIESEYTWKTKDWPKGLFNIHVRVYDHRVPEKRGRVYIAEGIHKLKVI